jgi:dihydrodipicolinate synthase/N-acetylneuraminate lyase
MTQNEFTGRDLDGILVALVTPFSADASEVDLEAIPAVIEKMVAAGVSGVIPCGSTGEFNALSTAERKAVAEAVVAAAGGRVAVVPHVGSLRPDEASELMAHAAGIGADAVMAVPPFYDKLTWPEVVRYYRTISAAAPQLPIMAYHYPEATGALITIDQVRELVDAVPAVRYMKDSGGDAQLLDQLLAEADGILLRVFNGSDTLTFHGLAGGAVGSVWGAASFMPELAVEFLGALRDRADLAEARRLWRLIRPICELLESNVYPAAVKAGCELVGMQVGPTRAPLGPIDDQEKERFRELLAAAGLVGDGGAA